MSRAARVGVTVHDEDRGHDELSSDQLLAELDHDLEPGCEMNYHIESQRPAATHALILIGCGHYDLLCGPCAEAMRARARSCRNPYVRCRECGDTRVGSLGQLLRITHLPGRRQSASDSETMEST